METEKYEKLTYQTAKSEMIEQGLDKIQFIIKDHKHVKVPGEDEINQELLKLTGKDLVTEIY